MSTVASATPASLLEMTASTRKVEETMRPLPPFDPAIHLSFQPPATRHTFTELDLPVSKGCPDICYTDPFQLFSEEGVRMIRREVFQKSFLDKYMCSWDRAPCAITGHAPVTEDGIFLKEAWNHPVTRAAVNFAFGAELKLQGGDSDMGYINVQLGPEGLAGAYKIKEEPASSLSVAESLQSSQYDSIPIDSWHKDQTPVVLVLMLNDTSTMIGGETAVKTGDGTIIKTRGGAIGGAVMMAGGHLEHAALRAENCSERLSLVNSYVYADPDADDSSSTLKGFHINHDNLTNAMNNLIFEKLTRLRDRCDVALAKIEDRRKKGERPGREEVEDWVKDQIYMLKHTSWEIFERVPNYVGKEIPEGTLKGYLSDV
ncbi:hypothetical protein BHE90_013026 [Fusarium euwallaceae]|uniref:Fe2OG dioxygenase domain-containing protein n=1 Tax=Fusarium euwallaceae TaxID=1147111 RepID=A0A430LA92_9HYPO|nr:hypothetical protein BHE90_013026 [Fusarium euwallaceae]